MKKEQFLSGRVYLLIAVMGLWGTVIGARLYFLQVVQYGSYRERADEQQQKTIQQAADEFLSDYKTLHPDSQTFAVYALKHVKDLQPPIR